MQPTPVYGQKKMRREVKNMTRVISWTLDFIECNYNTKNTLTKGTNNQLAKSHVDLWVKKAKRTVEFLVSITRFSPRESVHWNAGGGIQDVFSNFETLQAGS